MSDDGTDAWCLLWREGYSVGSSVVGAVILGHTVSRDIVLWGCGVGGCRVGGGCDDVDSVGGRRVGICYVKGTSVGGCRVERYGARVNCVRAIVLGDVVLGLQWGIRGE